MFRDFSFNNDRLGKKDTFLKSFLLLLKYLWNKQANLYFFNFFDDLLLKLVKHTERIGKNFMLFNYNAFYTQIIILIFGLLDLIAALEN